MTTTEIILNDAQLKLLKRAQKNKSISIFFEEGQLVADGLVRLRLLEKYSYGEYAITPSGTSHVLGLTVSTSCPDPAPLPVVPDTPLPKKARTPVANHLPQGVNAFVRPKKFGQLSPRQKDVLRFIDNFTRSVGYPPSIREIGDSTDITSTSVVNYNIEKLTQWGWLERTDKVSRGIRLIQEMPGKKTKNDINVDHGVLKISINLAGSPDDVMAAARAGIERLQAIAADALADGAREVNHATE